MVNKNPHIFLFSTEIQVSHPIPGKESYRKLQMGSSTQGQEEREG